MIDKGRAGACLETEGGSVQCALRTKILHAHLTRMAAGTKVRAVCLKD